MVKLGRAGWRSVAAVMLMLLPTIPLYTATNQAYNLVIVWAEAHMQRSAAGLTMPVTWLLTLDGLMTIAGIGLTIPV